MFGAATLVDSEAPIGFVPLPAPTCLMALGSTSSIDLAWKHEPDVAQYGIYRGESSEFVAEESTLHVTVPGSDSSFTDDQVVADYNYY